MNPLRKVLSFLGLYKEETRRTPSIIIPSGTRSVRVTLYEAAPVGGGGSGTVLPGPMPEPVMHEGWSGSEVKRYAQRKAIFGTEFDEDSGARAREAGIVIRIWSKAEQKQFEKDARKA